MDFTTPKELAVLRSIYYNWYGDHGRCSSDGRDLRLTSPVWSDCINHSHKPSGLEGRSLAGVVSSLKEKGLLDCRKGIDGDLITMTERGLAALNPPPPEPYVRNTWQDGVIIKSVLVDPVTGTEIPILNPPPPDNA